MLERKKMTALLCCGLVSACAVLDEKRDANIPVENRVAVQFSNQQNDALSWLAAYRTLGNASLDEQRKEYLAAQAALSKEANESNRLRLALALSLPNVPWRDDNRLLNTLESPPSLIKSPDSPVHQLGFLLYRQAQERQRLRDEQRRHENDLLDEQKQRLRDEQRRREAELLDEQRRNDELQMKLDALRRIDQDIKLRKHDLESTP